MGKGALGGETAHDDEVIEGLTVQRDVRHSQVDVGSQPAVELDLTPAVLGPIGQGREIGEVEAERFAEFEHPFTEERQDRECASRARVDRARYTGELRIVGSMPSEPPPEPRDARSIGFSIPRSTACAFQSFRYKPTLTGPKSPITPLATRPRRGISQVHLQADWNLWPFRGGRGEEHWGYAHGPRSRADQGEDRTTKCGGGARGCNHVPSTASS